MNAPLKWAMALSAAAILGFTVGRYLDDREQPPPREIEFPTVLPADSASPDPTPTVAATRQIPGTLRQIMQLRGDFTQTAALYVLAAGLDRNGIERLLEEAETIQRVSERRAAATILYERYAELDPAAAIDHMTRGEAEPDVEWLYTVFYAWARTNLDAALARAAKLDDRYRMVAGTAIVRSRDDLPTAQRQALASKLEVQVAARDQSTMGLRSPHEAQRSWQSALANTDREARNAELFAIARGWARQDPQAAMRAIESLRERGQREMLLQVALQSWAQKDPRAAAEWVLARPPSHGRAQLISTALGTLLMKEPSAAMAMLERLPLAERQQVMPSLVMRWASVDLRAAAAWLETQGDEPTHQAALQILATVYAERDPDAALRWAGSLPDENKELVMGQVIERIARDDPERAGSIARQMTEGPQRASAILAVAQTWAQSDPRAALSWLQMQSGSDATPDVYREIFGQWAAYDAEAALNQTNFLLESRTRNAAIIGILQSASLGADAVERLYQRLDGVEAKRLAAAQLYFLLRDSNPQAAERYRIEAGIDERNLGFVAH